MNLTLNGLPIIVDQVAAEEIIRRHLLNGDTAVDATAMPGAAHIPQLKAGEKYLGAHCGPDGKLVHTILLPGVARGKNWQAAMEWAVDQGGYLPNRIEGAMLFAYLKAEFENEVYWLGEQCADADMRVIHEVLANPRQIDHDGNAHLLQVPSRSDAGSHQDRGGVKCARRYNDFTSLEFA